MDKDLQKILDQSRKGEPVVVPQKPARVFPKNKPYDYLVFTKLVRFSGFFPLLFLLIIPLALAVGFLFPGMLQGVIWSYAIYGGLVALYLLINRLRYHLRFVGWQERLPFRLEGWNEIIHEKKMYCDLCWNDMRIEVMTTDRQPEILELVQAALKIFAKRSTLAFYDEKMGSRAERSRSSWKVASQTTAEGSANPEVMGYMKDMLERQLATIARKTGKIPAVKVSLVSQEFEVPIEIRSGD